jgi:hypothetical protein
MAWRSNPEAPAGRLRSSHIGKPIFRVVVDLPFQIAYLFAERGLRNVKP